MLIALLFVAAFASFAISAVAGGGAGLVLVPLLRLVVPIASVPAALTVGTAASAASRIALFRRDIRWDVVCRFVPFALPMAALGAWLLTRFEAAYLNLLIGAFLLANLPALFRKRAAAAPAPPLPLARVPWLGAAAGLLSGFTGAVGLVFNRAYQRLGLTPAQIVATRATNEVLIHAVKLALYWRFGLLDRPALIAGGVVAVAAVLASAGVRRVLKHLSTALFARIGQAATVAAGATMLWVSTGEVAHLHRAWIAVVAPEGEREVQLYWRAQRRLAIEREPEGGLVVERTVAFNDLPPDVRRAALNLARREDIRLIEAVHGADGEMWEVYVAQGKAMRTVELRREGGAVVVAS